MPYILVIMYFVSQADTQQAKLDHVDSIRFEDEKACKAAWAWLADRLNGIMVPGGGYSPNNLRIDCLPAKSVAP